MNTDLIRFIDSISRDKNIDKESVFCDLEAATASAVRKANEEAEEVAVRIDRATGSIVATVDGKQVDMKTLGRIAAQTAKQVMIQKIREDERSAIFEEYSERVGAVVTGSVTRYDGGGLTVNLGRGEGFLPRSEMIPGDQHQPGERIRAMILNVREEQSQVRIVLTQTHPDYIRKLFELEVPEVSERIIEIRALAREAGYRTKVAVSSIDTKVDAVGACVGVRGSRIRNIVDELGGEKIDIVRWNESSQVLITNALKPAEIKETFLCFELGRATVIVDEDQLSLAIGKRGQNVRLAAQLTGWDIDILTPAEYNKAVDDMETALKKIESVEDVLLDKMLAMGFISLGDLAEVGVDPLVKELEMDEDQARTVVEVAAEEAKRIAAETEAAKRAAAGKPGESEAAVGKEGEGEAAAGKEGEGEAAVGKEGEGEAVAGKEGEGEAASVEKASDDAAPLGDEAVLGPVAVGPVAGEPDESGQVLHVSAEETSESTDSVDASDESAGETGAVELRDPT